MSAMCMIYGDSEDTVELFRTFAMLVSRDLSSWWHIDHRKNPGIDSYYSVETMCGRISRFLNCEVGISYGKCITQPSVRNVPESAIVAKANGEVVNVLSATTVMQDDGTMNLGYRFSRLFYTWPGGFGDIDDFVAEPDVCDKFLLFAIEILAPLRHPLIEDGYQIYSPGYWIKMREGDLERNPRPATCEAEIKCASFAKEHGLRLTKRHRSCANRTCGMCFQCSFDGNFFYTFPLGCVLDNYPPLKGRGIPMHLNVKYLLCTNRDVIDDPVAMRVANLLGVEVVVCT